MGAVRVLAGLCAASLLFASCTTHVGVHPAGFRVLPKNQVIAYRVDIAQKRTAAGLGPRKSLASTVSIDVDEEADTSHSYTLVVKAARATGEETQRNAAARMV